MADPARPRLLRVLAAAPLVSDNPGPVPFGVGPGDLVFSADGRTLASVSGRDQVTVWNVTHPGRAARVATLTGPRDYFAGLAFAPSGNLLGGVTYHGTVVVYRLTSPARPDRRDRPPRWPSPAGRDTILTWRVNGTGALSDLTTTFRNVNDAQPALAPGDRMVADGAVDGERVHLWALP